MYDRITETKEDIIKLVQNGKIDVFVRFANTSNNWTSSFDKEIAKAFPRFQELDIVDAKIGDTNSANIRVKNLYIIGDKVVTLVNAYVYDKKDNRGRYELDDNALLSIIQELDKNHRGRIIGFDFQHDTSYSKSKIIKNLRNNLKFSKVTISE